MKEDDEKEQLALVKWEPKGIALRLNAKAERKRDELLRAVREGLLHDPISILIAVGVSAAVSAGGYVVSRMLAPKQKPQRVGQLTGNIQLQNSEQGLFIPELYGGSPAFSPSAGANPVPQNNANGSSEGDGGYTKVSGGAAWNCGMSHNVQVNAGDNAFIRFKVGIGYAGAGFSTTASPLNADTDFKFGIQWNPPDSSITLRHNNTNGLAGAATFAPGDEFTLELRDGRFRLFKEAAEITPPDFTFPTPTYPLWLGVAVFTTGAGMSECKVLVGPDIGPPPNGGAGGVKVPALIVWTSGLRKVETPVQQQTGGGKGHSPTETVIQVSYNLDVALMFGRGPLKLIREYANADIILNQDPNSSAATGVYDPTVGGDPNYPLDDFPDPLEGYVRPRFRLDGELDPLNPGDPGEGSGGIVQGGSSATNVYPGSLTQLPDPTIEADTDGKFGPGSTPAHRGKAYIVHNTFKLDRWQGVVPNFVGVWEHQTLKTLALIFAHFCERESMVSGDFDFAGLNTALPVRGLKIDGGRYSPAAVMDSPELQAMFNYFTTEGGGKVLAFVNGTEPSIFIPESDFGWIDGETEAQDVVQTITPTVDKESSKPKQVEVKYVHPGNDWDVDLQLEQRRNTDGKEKKTIEVNVTALPDEARAAAQRVLYQDYVAGTKYKFTLPWTYVSLYPGYRITTTTSDGFSYDFRLTSINGGIGLMECEAVALEISAFSQSAVGTTVPDYNPGQTIPTMTVAAYLDIPARSPAELQGILIAGCPRTNVGQAYRGFTVWLKQNNQWVSLATVVGVAVVGKVVSSTTLSPDPNAVDNDSQIVVDLYNNGFLSSVPEADMVAGANRGAFGQLVCGFASATQDPAFPNRWILSKLLNGQNNTRDRIGDALAGTFFVLLDDAVKFVPLSNEFLDTAVTLRAVTFGQSLIDAAEVSFTWTGQSMRSQPPTGLLVAKDGTNDILIQCDLHPSVAEQPALGTVEIWTDATRNDPATKRKRSLPLTEGSTHAVLLDAQGDVVVDPVTNDVTLLSGTYANKNNLVPSGVVSVSAQTFEALEKTWTRFDFTFRTSDPSSPGTADPIIVAALEENDVFETSDRLFDYAVSPVSITWASDGGAGTLVEKVRNFNTVVSTRSFTWDAISKRYSILLSGTEYRVYDSYMPGAGQVPISIITPPGSGFSFPLRLHLWLVDSGFTQTNIDNIRAGGNLRPTTIYAEREWKKDFSNVFPPVLHLRLFQNGVPPIPDGIPLDVAIPFTPSRILQEGGDELLAEGGEFLIQE